MRARFPVGKKWVAAVIAVTLIACVAMQTLTGEQRAGLGRHLDQWIKAPGWQSREESLGATEAVSSRIAEGLKFDDHVYRTFSKADIYFSVYIAYWSPGKPARGLVGEHTPDSCWPLHGCVPLERRSEFALYGDDVMLPRCEWRRFRMTDGSTTEVAFWHVVGGKVLHFDNHSPLRWLRAAAGELSVARREQYFVRITTRDGGFELLKNEVEFRNMLRNVGRLVRQ